MSGNSTNKNVSSFFEMIKKMIKSNDNIIKKIKREIKNTNDETIKLKHNAHINKLNEKIDNSKIQLLSLGEQLGMSKDEIIRDLENFITKQEESQSGKIL